jgi:hypothetical protein
MWRTHKAANRPWPVISQDDVIDYMVMEAVALKVRTEDEKAEKQRQREEFKKDKSRLNKFR